MVSFWLQNSFLIQNNCDDIVSVKQAIWIKFHIYLNWLYCSFGRALCSSRPKQIYVLSYMFYCIYWIVWTFVIQTCDAVRSYNNPINKLIVWWLLRFDAASATWIEFVHTEKKKYEYHRLLTTHTIAMK